MSEFAVEVVTISEVRPHPNADRLDIAQVFGFPVIVKRWEYAAGDTAIYVPVDAVVPDTEQWRWLNGGAPLGKHARIRAKKLRGVFSMGLLAKPAEYLGQDPHYPIGHDVAEVLGITKYEPPEPSAYIGGDSERDPGFMPVYTAIESLRRRPYVLVPGEEVVITEKIHGANARYCWHDGRFWAGSHRQVKKDEERSLWWRAAKAIGLPEKMERECPGLVLYGEVYGQVQDLRYGAGQGEVRLRAFDAFVIATGRYVDADKFVWYAQTLGVPVAPALYRGPWSPDLMSLADGPTTVDGAAHMREGFVVRPMVERFDPHIGRVILKHVGEEYLLRKGGSEGK